MDEPDVGPARGPSNRAVAFRVLALAALFAMVLLSLGYFFNGKIGVEKTLTNLVMPFGMLWLLLSGYALHLLLSRASAAVVAVGAWLIVSIGGSAPLADSCMRYLETRETAFQPSHDEDLDVLVVLGGGTNQGPHRAQAGSSGDRVLYAAQLHIQGHAKRLITTGDAIPGFAGERSSPREQTIEIWSALGIERDAIGTLTGLNTYQEIQSLRELKPELAGQRVGLLTSAYHLPRAMRLARAQGMDDLIPVAADYQSNSESFTYIDFLPSPGGFRQLARCQHEWMAWLVNR